MFHTEGIVYKDRRYTMEIKSLKDLKDALGSIADEDAKNLGFNWHEEGEEVQLLAFSTEDDPSQVWARLNEKYPQLQDVEHWVKALIEAGIEAHEQEVDEMPEDMISSKDYEDAKSSSCLHTAAKEEGLRA